MAQTIIRLVYDLVDRKGKRPQHTMVFAMLPQFGGDPFEPFADSLRGHALSAEKAPITSALHCATTRSGMEMMNSGEPMTGNRSRLRSTLGNAIK